MNEKIRKSLTTNLFNFRRLNVKNILIVKIVFWIRNQVQYGFIFSNQGSFHRFTLIFNHI